MKHLITITLLSIISLSINAHFVNQVKMQKRANYRWDRDLARQGYSKWDNYEEPKEAQKVVECMKWINYVVAQEKYYRGK